MKEIYVTGSAGLVASRFVEIAEGKYHLITPEVNKLDITDYGALVSYFENTDIDVIVNTAAFTLVDKAEEQRGGTDGSCYQVNAIGAENLANLAKDKGAFLIQISTDFIFPGDGNDPGPYEEDHPLPLRLTDSIGWYGWTKAAAEKKIVQVGGRSAIVRISYPFRCEYPGKTDFVRNILSLYDGGKLYPMFDDQKMTLTYIDEFALGLIRLIDLGKEGVYHFANSGVTTPYEIAVYTLEKARRAGAGIKKGSLMEFLKREGSIPRPVNGGLLNKKTQEELGFRFSTWKEAIEKFLKETNNF